ncbi:MAG: SulP family inorganic anion transporter, partial [Chloroflexota bacterium]
FSQLRHVLGYNIPRADHFYQQVLYLFGHIGQTNPVTLLVGLGAIGVLLVFRYPLAARLKAWLPEAIAVPLSKLGPLVVVVAGVVIVSQFGLAEAAGVDIVGDVPEGLPGVTVPLFNLAMWQAVLPTAIALSLVGYMESISVAKALASKKRQKINPHQEFIALGAANIGAAFTGAFPVTGGLSRTVVNDAAGARTGMASIFTALLIILTVMFLTPLFFYLPSAVLAAIILVAVAKLFDWHAFVHAWQYDRADGLSLLVTFAAVLIAGIEAGILIGAGVSLVLYLYRTSKPHTAVIGRIPETEHFRNVKRHDVETHPEVLLFRVDESLYFPNAAYLEQQMLELVVDNPEVEHVVLVCSAVNYIDVSALEVLERLLGQLRSSGVAFYMAEVKGPVMDRLKQVGFIDHLGEDHIFLSTQHAYEKLRTAT